MVKAQEPDRIPILSVNQLQQEVNALTTALAKDETEHTWEIIDKAVKRFHAVVRGGGAKAFPEEFLRCMRDKAVAQGIIRSLITERTRLSGTTLDLMAACTRLGHGFLPLLSTYFPAILRLLCRTNKLYISRAAATVASIISHTHLSDILKWIVVEWKAESGKSNSFREKAAEALGVALGVGGGEMMIEKEGLEKRMEELEWIIRTGATDREAKVRGHIKQCWEIYKTTWPERVPQFTAPMTPVIRRYLNVGAGPPAGASGAGPSRPPVKKPKVPSGLSSSVSAASSKPSSSLATSHKPSSSLSASTSSKPAAPRHALSSSTSRAPTHTTTTTAPKEPLRHLSKSVGASVGMGHPPHGSSHEHTRTVSGSTSSSRSASRNQDRDETSTRAEPSASSKPAPVASSSSSTFQPASLKSSTSTSSLSQSHSRPQTASIKPSESTSSLASSTSGSRPAAAPSAHHGPFKPSTSSRPPLPASLSSSSLGGEPRKARRVAAATAPPLPTTTTSEAPTPALSRSTSSNPPPSLSTSVGRTHARAMPTSSSTTTTTSNSGPFRPQMPAGAAAKVKAAVAAGAGASRVAGAAPSATRGGVSKSSTATARERERARSPDGVRKPTPAAPSAATLAVRERKEREKREKEETTVVAAVSVEPEVVVEEGSSEAELERLVGIVEEGAQFSSPRGEEKSVEGNVLQGLEDGKVQGAQHEEEQTVSQETVIGEVGMDSTIVLEESQSASQGQQAEYSADRDEQPAVVESTPAVLEEPLSDADEQEQETIRIVGEVDAQPPSPARVVVLEEQTSSEVHAEAQEPVEVAVVELLEQNEPVGDQQEAATISEEQPIIVEEPLPTADRSSPVEHELPAPTPANVAEQVASDVEAEDLVDVPDSPEHDLQQEEEENVAEEHLVEEEAKAPVVVAREDLATAVSDAMIDSAVADTELHVNPEHSVSLSDSSPPSSPIRSSSSAPSPPASPTFANLPSPYHLAAAPLSPEPFAQTCSIVMETPPRWDPKQMGGIRLPGFGGRAVVEDEQVEVEEQEANLEEHVAPPSPSPSPSPARRQQRAMSSSPSPGLDFEGQEQGQLQEESAIFLPDDSLAYGAEDDSSFEEAETTREFDVPLNDASMASASADETEVEGSPASTINGREVDELAPTVILSPSSRLSPYSRIQDDEDEARATALEEDEDPESSFELEMEQDHKELIFHDEEESDVSTSTIAPVEEPESESEPEPEPKVLKRSLRSRTVTVELEVVKKTPARSGLSRSRSRSQGAVLGEVQG